MSHRFFLAAAAVLLATAAGAHDYTLGKLAIEHPHAIETPASAKTGAGYLTISNSGDTGDRLIAVRTEFPRSEIHTVETDAAGVSRMRPVEAVEIPAGGTVVLAPQGMHVMFMGLEEPLVAGESIPATLEFETAGTVAVEFRVEPRNTEASDMPAMTH
jgi:copper(I)-binding protein